MKTVFSLAVIILGMILALQAQYDNEYGKTQESEGLYRGHNESYYLHLADKATRQRTRGIIGTFVGIGAVAGGYYMMTLDNKQQNKTGAIIYITGIVLSNIGPIVWITGAIKRANNYKAVDIAKHYKY